MSSNPYGTVLAGNEEDIRRSYQKWAEQPVDMDWSGGRAETNDDPRQTMLGQSVSVSGPGTFLGRAQRTLVFEPTRDKGWRFHRRDLRDSMPIHATVNNVWTVVRNIVLCSGSPHNYARMVEHIVALKVGLNLDNVMIGLDSGDPPLFDRGSMDLVEAVEQAGITASGERAVYVTVKEPVSVAGQNGGFLTFLPREGDSRELLIDCAVDFRSAIGKQRIRFPVNKETFRHGALARTNTTFGMMVYCKTIGKLFADTRNLGYTTKNILVAGRRRYFNAPKLIHAGKSLEAVWHRAALDLLAAVALIDRGRFAGGIISYKAGHALDVRMIRELYRRDLLEET